jgi:hypothetical protein
MPAEGVATPAIPATPETPPTPATPATPDSAPAMSPQAQAHYKRGLDLYADRDFTAAAGELEQGFAIDPRREFLFAEAQALRLAGQCPRAIPLYRRFLESKPSPLQIEAAQLGLDRCNPNRSAQPPPAVRTALTVPAESQSAPIVPNPPTPEQRIWWQDLWAGSALGLGAVALGTGIGFVVASNRAVDESMSQRIALPEFQRLRESAQQRRIIGVTCLVASAGLAAAAGVRLILVRRRQDQQAAARSTLSFAPARYGGALTWETKF